MRIRGTVGGHRAYFHPGDIPGFVRKIESRIGTIESEPGFPGAFLSNIDVLAERYSAQNETRQLAALAARIAALYG